MTIDFDEEDELQLDEELLSDKEDELQELTAEYLAAETEWRRWSKLLRHAELDVEHGRRRLQKWTSWLEAARSPRTRHEAGEEGAGWLVQQGWLGQRRRAKEERAGCVRAGTCELGGVRGRSNAGGVCSRNPTFSNTEN